MHNTTIKNAKIKNIKNAKNAKNAKIRLGLCCMNTSLRAKGIFTSRTCRLETARDKGIQYLESLFHANLEDLQKMLEWNERNGIRVFRMSSEMAPHITNDSLIKCPKNKNNWRCLVYPLEQQRSKLQEIGNWAKKHGHRLTFHPGQYINLGSPNPNVITRGAREIYYHTRIMDLMGLGGDSVIVIHGGGVYNDKLETMKRWVKVFNAMPVMLKRRIVIENDETCYSINDIFTLSRSVKYFNRGFGESKSKYHIPVVFDLFHYYCYNTTISRKRDGFERIADQMELKDIWARWLKSWNGIRPKMHISEQARVPILGKHSFLVSEIPRFVFQVASWNYTNGFDIMIEAKGKEKAIKHLYKKHLSLSF